MAGTMRRIELLLRAVALVAVAISFAPGAAVAGGRSGTLRPEQIRLVQRALTDRGLAVPVTGAWDARTRTALGQFQVASGLPSTGDIDAATSRALGFDPSLVVPVGGRMGSGFDPAVNCGINTTIDCRPGP